MTAPPRLPRVLAIHPVSRGFGWVVFEGPLCPIDWGFSITKGEKNIMCLEKVDVLIARHLPETLVLESFEQRYSNRSERMTRLGRALQTLAASRGIDVAIFSRIDLKVCFRSHGAQTKQEIAEAIARNLDAFRAYLPRKRTAWGGESDQMALFHAAALGLTHYYLSANQFLRLLSRPDAHQPPTESA